MAGLVPAIYVFAAGKKDVDARIRGHDGDLWFAPSGSCGRNLHLAFEAMFPV
jgi:hypothetical protein